MLYEWHDFVSQSVKLSMQTAANALSFSGGLMNVFKSAANPPGYGTLANQLMQSAKAINELAHDQPDPVFGLWRTQINGESVAVNEDVIMDKPFGRLLRFRCEPDGKPRNVPKVLIVAPISGNKATILRDTVRELIPDCDVYITQWKDARDIPLKDGSFDLAEYMAYVQDFIHTVGPRTHLIGISQSTVPVLAVTSLLAALEDDCQPLSMTLMCGPIDPRINETAISRQSREHDIGWFRRNMTMPVPLQYPGRGRQVFPGFLQAMGMLFAAPGQKKFSPASLVGKLYNGQGEKLDADAPYYLDTIEQVFLEHRLPKGTMMWRGEKIDPSKIRKTALFTIEGSRDDITAPGQTYIAHKLCDQLDPKMKRHHLQSGAGHYDLFSGPHWKTEISNEFKDFIRKIAATHGIAYDPPQADTPVENSRIASLKSVLAA